MATSAGASDLAEVHLNIDLAQTTLQAPGTTPVEWLAVDPARAVHRAEPDQ